MTAACVWSNGAWSRLWLWIMDDSCEEVRAVHGLCRHVLSKRWKIPHISCVCIFFPGCAWSSLDQNLLRNEDSKWQPSSLYWWCSCFFPDLHGTCPEGLLVVCSKNLAAWSISKLMVRGVLFLWVVHVSPVWLRHGCLNSHLSWLSSPFLLLKTSPILEKSYLFPLPSDLSLFPPKNNISPLCAFSQRIVFWRGSLLP